MRPQALDPSDVRAWRAHQARPLSVVAFAQSTIGLRMPALFPRQAAFLADCFPTPTTVDSPIFSASYREAVACWGKGSGKDTVASIAQLYVVYRLMLHPDPQAWLRLVPDSNIDLVNVAYNAQQAKTVYFEMLKSKLTKSPFFAGLLARVLGFSIRDDVQAGIIKFPKQVFAHSLHSQGEAAEGKNTLFAVMDEADAFTDASGARNAEKVYRTLSTSMASRFPGVGLVMVISWPRHQESFTIKKYEASLREQDILGSRGATWDIRPDRKRDDFAKEYRENPEEARAKFETLPPATEDAFFTLPEKIDAAFRGSTLVQYAPRVAVRDVRGEDKEFSAVDILATSESAHSYWIHCDAGLRKDSYALAMVRCAGDERYVDALITWDPTEGRPVDFLDVERVIALLASKYRVQAVTFDQWNSAETVQRVQALAIHSEMLSFSQPQQLAMYETLKKTVYAGRATFPNDSPASDTLKRELRRLQLLNGRKVDHPSGESKDVADAVAAACYLVREDQPSPPPGQVAPDPTRSEELRELGVGGFNDMLLRRQW